MSEFDSDFGDDQRESDVDENYIGVSFSLLVLNFLRSIVSFGFNFRTTSEKDLLMENATALEKQFCPIEINTKVTTEKVYETEMEFITSRTVLDTMVNGKKD
jgi:hypothetical protein